MRINERKLRSVIRGVIRESYDQTFKEGDRVRVMYVDPPYTGHRMDWGGCDGIITRIYTGTNMCQVAVIKDPTGELELLHNIPLKDLEKV